MGAIPATSSLGGSVVWLAAVGLTTFLVVYLAADRRRIGRRAMSVLVSVLALGLTCA
jgi:hypothetical protein